MRLKYSSWTGPYLVIIQAHADALTGMFQHWHIYNILTGLSLYIRFKKKITNFTILNCKHPFFKQLKWPFIWCQLLNCIIWIEMKFPCWDRTIGCQICHWSIAITYCMKRENGKCCGFALIAQINRDAMSYFVILKMLFVATLINCHYSIHKWQLMTNQSDYICSVIHRFKGYTS